MSSEPPASDLAAPDLGLALAHLRDLAATGKQWSGMRSDLRALLAAYDAQAARLAAVEAERDELLREIDKGCAGMLLVAHALDVYSKMGTGPWPPWEVLRQRATRLAALEAAARRLAGHHGPVHCNCQTCRQFRDAVAALDAPPGEGR